MKKSRRFLAVAAPLVLVSFTALLPGCGGSSSSGGLGVLGSVPTATLAGGALAGSADGGPGVASFNNPVNVALDSAGNVYVCDFDSNRIRKITPAGIVSTLTNQGNFARPFGITFTPSGRLFVSTDDDDTGAHTPSSGTLWEISLPGGAATVIQKGLGRPRGIAALSDTQIVLVDLNENDVRIINPNTKVITPVAGLRGTPGFANGSGTTARFNRPYGPAITLDGNILLADQTNNALRLITPAGAVTTFSGSGAGYQDGNLSQALFNNPQDVDIDNMGNVYVSDNGNHRIRKISSGGQVSTIAGDGTMGFQDGNGAQARFYGQEGLAVKRDGSLLFVADGNGGDGSDFNRVRQLQLQ